jgi:hypothetical protein
MNITSILAPVYLVFNLFNNTTQDGLVVFYNLRGSLNNYYIDDTYNDDFYFDDDYYLGDDYYYFDKN